MAQNVFSIDGRYFDIFIPQDGIKRSAQILDSSETERKMDGSLHRSIIGTYYNYTIDIRTDNLSTEEYDELFDLISQPEVSHEITVPYGQTSKTFNAYISSVEDSLKRIENGKCYWAGMQLKFIAIDPAILA